MRGGSEGSGSMLLDCGQGEQVKNAAGEDGSVGGRSAASSSVSASAAAAAAAAAPHRSCFLC